jgi:short-subunit dehydrogenase
MNTSIHSGTALITGACSGIGGVYADRLARRDHDLVLVAHDRDRLCAMASGITDDTGRSIEVLAVDIATKEGLRSAERVLATDASMTMLVNNAGTGATAPMHLACAAWPGFAARGHGTIINIAAIAAAPFNGVPVDATAFVLAFSRSLHHALAPQGIRVQAVLPAGMIMSITDMVDAALVGLDLGEIVTIPGRPFANGRAGRARIRPPS